jgi:hypothetical protein
VRRWQAQADIDVGQDGLTTIEGEERSRLRRENRVLRKNERSSEKPRPFSPRRRPGEPLSVHRGGEGPAFGRSALSGGADHAKRLLRLATSSAISSYLGQPGADGADSGHSRAQPLHLWAHRVSTPSCVTVSSACPASVWLGSCAKPDAATRGAPPCARALTRDGSTRIDVPWVCMYRIAVHASTRSTLLVLPWTISTRVRLPDQGGSLFRAKVGPFYGRINRGRPHPWSRELRYRDIGRTDLSVHHAAAPAAHA